MSSLKDLASLIMVPSLYKDGELHTVKPLGNSILHPDATGNHDGTDGSTPSEGNFTFSRGSNLAATRVASSGYIEKGRENRLLHSNDFTLGNWGNDAGTCTRTGGQSGYDGTNDAWLITQDTAGYDNIRSLSTGLTSGVSTMSVYAKAGTSNNMHIRVPSDASRVQFNLSTGVATNKGGAIYQGMDDVGGGWYRCYATFNSNVDLVQIYPEFGSSTPVSIYIQDAQLEAGLVATDYIETGASTAQAGILEDMPRLDYSGGATCPSLLLEPQRSNLILHSEYTDGANWSNEGSIVDEENTSETISPEGVYNAVKLVSANATSEQWIQATGISVTTGNDCTISCFVKKSDYDYFHIRFTGIGGAFAAGSIWFNIANGTLGTAQTGITGTIENYGNGWYRISATKEVTATAFAGVRFQLASSDNNTSVVGDGSKGTYIYGCQAELGSYPTSYIPTYGASVTRSLDNISTTFSSSLTSGGNVSVLFEIDAAYRTGINSTSDNLAFIFSDDDRIIFNTGGGSKHRIELNVAGRTEYIYKTMDIYKDERIKVCTIVTDKTYEIYANGSLQFSGTFTGTGNWTSADSFNSTLNAGIGVLPVQQMVYFPTALTSSEAIALTTL